MAYAPGSWPATAVPTAAERQVLSRFSYGGTPALVRAVDGGRHLDWFDAQLVPARITDPATTELETWWPDLRRTPLDLWMRQVDGTRNGGEVMRDYGAWTLARRARSQRQVLEVMTEFWENHLHVPASGDGYFTWRPHYGRTIRLRALGRYEDLLVAAVLHPAMLTYLNAATSTKSAPNENLGRELLELHTLGVGRYSEDDVKSSARILTGWRVDVNDTWQRLYVPEYHWTGKVKVRDFEHANTSNRGRSLSTAYLRYLARHPDTAKNLARKLVAKFVREPEDDPHTDLVEALAKTYLAKGTAITPVLRQLVRSPEFASARGTKLRDAGEDVVATYRALGITLQQPVDNKSGTAAMLAHTGQLGLTAGSWPRPDGAPQRNAAWATPLRALASLDVHWQLANRAWPTAQVVHRDPASWAPQLPIAFRDLVDHLSRVLLLRPSTATLLETCCVATAIDQAATITADHWLVKNNGMGRLLAALLDTPEHYSR